MGIDSRKINGLCACIFILAVAALFYLRYSNLWAGMMIAGGVTAALRELMLARMFGIVIAALVFGAAWACVTYEFYQGVTIPLLATAGALYLLVAQIKKSSGAE